MKKLFLASSFQDVAHLLPDLEQTLSGKTVTFIPTASKVETVVFYVKAGRKALEKMGLIIDELELSTASADEIRTKIEHNDFIYITGGNTFYLLQELKRTGADKIIIEAVKAGKLYIGESAGAIITAANIEYIKAMDSVKKAPALDHFEGLNLVDFYPLPHYHNPPFQKIGQKIMAAYSSTLNLSPISNHDAILVNDCHIEIKTSNTED